MMEVKKYPLNAGFVSLLNAVTIFLPVALFLDSLFGLSIAISFACALMISTIVFIVYLNVLRNLTSIGLIWVRFFLFLGRVLIFFSLVMFTSFMNIPNSGDYQNFPIDLQSIGLYLAIIIAGIGLMVLAFGYFMKKSFKTNLMPYTPSQSDRSW